MATRPPTQNMFYEKGEGEARTKMFDVRRENDKNLWELGSNSYLRCYCVGRRVVSRMKWSLWYGGEFWKDSYFVVSFVIFISQVTCFWHFKGSVYTFIYNTSHTFFMQRKLNEKGTCFVWIGLCGGLMVG